MGRPTTSATAEGPASGRRRPLARRRLALVAALATLVAAAAPVRAEVDLGLLEPPRFLEPFGCEARAVDPGWRADGRLERRLERAVRSLGLAPLVERGRLGVALVDLINPERPRLAELNGERMLYAASVPKIGVLYAAFEAAREGRLDIDDDFRRTLTDMIRVSSNSAASEAIHRLGFGYINAALWRARLYDPEQGGGLWIGKAYGGPDDYWHRDPLHGQSHGATPRAVARLLTLLAQGRLVSARASRDMLDILGNPGLHHKFVRGLDARPGSLIFRKSGTWRDWHGDAALVERDGKRYVAVALCQDPEGEAILERLIVALDDCVADGRVASLGPASPAGH